VSRFLIAQAIHRHSRCYMLENTGQKTNQKQTHCKNYKHNTEKQPTQNTAEQN